MSRNLQIAAGAIALVAVIGIGAFVFNRGKSTETTTPGSPEAQTQVKGTIAGLFGKNQTCTVKYPGQSTEGTIYVSGNKVRGDFTMTDPNGTEMHSSMINDSEYTYTWTPVMGQGVKIKNSAATEQTQDQNQDFDVNKEVDMKCSSWSPDNSKFTPPSDVQFMDLTQTQEQTQSPATASPGTSNSMCAQITDPQAKAACESYSN
ncbi:MAG: hypothetical protein NUV69_01465 [Candidatus Curtissbacteria bacterium]|nr:hypothetical protein [Candidatus Curtissbacteria bacterium]